MGVCPCRGCCPSGMRRHGGKSGDRFQDHAEPPSGVWDPVLDPLCVVIS